jgi:signal transduction histidine kinase/DNA-binding response OmpR family regulator
VLSRFSIRFRLILLSVVLMLGIVGTNLYLTRALGRASAAATESDRVDALIGTVDTVRNAFSDLRYWLTDLSVSLLTQSERNADAARVALAANVWTLRQYEPATAKQLAAEVAEFDTAAMQAVEAYTADQRVIGNSLTSQARAHGQRVDALLSRLSEDLSNRERSAGELVRQSAVAAQFVSSAVVLLAVLVGGVLTVLVLRSILVPLRDLVTAVEGVSRGDDTVTLPPARSDELGAMTRALALLRESQRERRRLAAEADAQRLTLADAIASLNEGFALYDAQDRLLVRNAKFVALHAGLEDVTVPGMSFASLLRAAIDRGIVTLGSQSAEDWIADRVRYRREAVGTQVHRLGTRWVQIGVVRTHDGGTATVYSDITELKHRQDELELARAGAEQASQVKSGFLANMSHELRTPLNAIIGYSQILAEDATEAGNQSLVDDLERIEGAGNHLLHLIDDILDLSKIEAGRMEIYIEPFDIRVLVEEIRLMMQPLAARNDNTLTVSFTSDVGTMHSDLTKVKQALLNLLTNACKFTKAGRVALTVAADPDAQGYLALTVTDSGIGMTAEELGRLFQAFAQADSSTTRKYGGSGLGLVITRSFARMLGGNVTVTSTPGQGSTFKLSLPIVSVAPSADEQIHSGAGDVAAPDEVVHEASPGTILVADDDAVARRIIGTHLSREGYHVIYAASGTEAIELAGRERPDAITLDIMMPQVDGWAVLRSLKADPRLAPIPVILVSMIADRGLGVSLGAAAVMCKPVDRADLAATIRAQCALAGSTPEAQSGGGVMLVVDDDPSTRELTAGTAVRLGFVATEVENGSAALAWLEHNQPPAAILLDLLMLEADGFKFLRELRMRSAWRDIPVIMLIAKSLSAAERAELEAVTRCIAINRSGADLGSRLDLGVQQDRGAQQEVTHAIKAVLDTAIG